MLKPLLRSSCAFSALFLLSAPVAAQSLADFQQQYRSGDFAAAYKTGAALMAEVGGDVAFEMAFAQSAYAAGKTDDAIFALERVLWIDLTNLAARLLLAEIYAQLGARDLAVEQAGYVLLDTDNDADRDRAQTVLAQMNRPEESPLSLEGAAGVSLGYAETDFATADDTIAATVAGFTDLTASWKVADGLTLHAGAKATASRLPQDGENNADNVALSASARWVRGSSGVDIGQSASRTWRSGALQGDALTTSAGYDHTFESGLKLSGGADLIRTSFPDTDNDAETLSLKVSASQKLDTDLPITLFGGLNWSDTTPYLINATTQEEVDNTATGGNLGAAVSLNDDLVWSLALSLKNSTYAGPATPREDQRWTVFNGLTWQSGERSTVSLGFTRQINTSNDADYSFARNQVSLTYTTRFGG